MTAFIVTIIYFFTYFDNMQFLKHQFILFSLHPVFRNMTLFIGKKADKKKFSSAFKAF